MKNLNVGLAGMWMAVVVLGVAGSASAVDTLVDVELSLVVDVSGSVSNTDPDGGGPLLSEFELQRTGYVNAFNSPTLAAAIAEGPNRAIAVNFVYWSVGQVESVGWTLIDGTPGNTAADFAALIAAAPRPDPATDYAGSIYPTDVAGSVSPWPAFVAQTGLANAIQFSANGFAENGFDSATRIIDVSGDGADNASGRFGYDAPEPMDAVDTARLDAVRVDVLGLPGEAVPGALVDIINGLAIGSELNVATPGDLVQYYKDHVIGVNPNWVQPAALNIEAPGFVVAVPGLDDQEKFNEAVLKKLTGVPEPATMVLLAAGGMLALIRRRKQRV